MDGKADAFRINRGTVSPSAWREYYSRYADHWTRLVRRFQRGMGDFDLLLTPTPEDTLCHPAGSRGKGTPRYDWIAVGDGIEAGYLKEGTGAEAR